MSCCSSCIPKILRTKTLENLVKKMSLKIIFKIRKIKPVEKMLLKKD